MPPVLSKLRLNLERGWREGRSPQRRPLASERFWRWRRLAASTPILPRLDARLGRHAAVLEAVRLVARLDDMTMMREPVQQRRRHLRVLDAFMMPPYLTA